MFFAGQKKLEYYKLHFILGIVVLFTFDSSMAQNYINGSPYHPNSFQTVVLPDHQSIQANRMSNQKWFVSQYAAVSVGSTFYSGVNSYYISAPVGWQLNRSLNKNLYAFAGVYMAPTFTSFGQTFMNAPYNKSFPATMYPHNYFSMNPGVQMGLMYINDAGTFSISGSIRAEARTYPVYQYQAAPNKNPKR